MEYSIKNKNLIISITPSDKGANIVIQRENKGSHNDTTKLSDVFNLIPHGIVQKDETGMGATTLEIEAPRNSIIVEPIKITASSKAHHHTKKSGEEVLYVGSETKYHLKKADKKKIQEYANDKNIKHKKILVVADSLYKVLDAIGPNVYKEYFLMIDEVDSFQMDSSFRSSMEDCIDYYKEFLDNNRCMLSATVIQLSDPDLANERITNISYDIQSPRDILVINSATNDIYGNVVDRIKEIQMKDPDNKIMVAFNSVTGVASIAEHLIQNGICNKGDIKILCSANSENKVPDIYAELDSEELPGKINFLTSAYFTGFDIKERYHLISVSGNKSKVHALSDKRLKQIAGRCREKLGLLSETVIHDLIDPKSTDNFYSKDEIIEAAATQVKALKCMHDNYASVPLLQRIQVQVTKQLMKALDDIGNRFVKYRKKDKEPKISYLNVDSFFESTSTRQELYQDYDTLSDTLKSAGHKVVTEKKRSSIVVDKVDLDTADKKQQVKEIMDFLRTNPQDSDILELLTTGRNTHLQKRIAGEYLKLRTFIEGDQLLDFFEEAAIIRDNKKFENLIRSAYFTIMAPGSLYKSRMDKYFNTGKPLTRGEILKRLQLVYNELGIPGKLASETKAIRLLKTCYKISPIRKTASKEAMFMVKSYNPLKFNIIGMEQEIEDINSFAERFTL